MAVPVEWLIVVVLYNFVATEQQAVERFCINNGSIKGFKYIILYNNARAVTTVEILFLRLQVGYFGVD